jgi:hypothetical protein
MPPTVRAVGKRPECQAVVDDGGVAISSIDAIFADLL